MLSESSPWGERTLSSRSPAEACARMLSGDSRRRAPSSTGWNVVSFRLSMMWSACASRAWVWRRSELPSMCIFMLAFMVSLARWSA